jgi:hypothetical protein
VPGENRYGDEGSIAIFGCRIRVGSVNSHDVAARRVNHAATTPTPTPTMVSTMRSAGCIQACRGLMEATTMTTTVVIPVVMVHRAGPSSTS